MRWTAASNPDLIFYSQLLWGGAMEQIWKRLFQGELGDPPRLLAAPCCSEFLVSRSAITAHPLSFYIRLRDWLVQTELQGYAYPFLLQRREIGMQCSTTVQPMYPSFVSLLLSFLMNVAYDPAFP